MLDCELTAIVCCDCRLRVQEGFHFVHTHQGILSLAIELDMQVLYCGLVDWLVFNAISAQIRYILPQEYEVCRVGPGTRQTIKQYTKPKKIISALLPGLCEDNLLTTNRLPQRCLSSQSLCKY